MAWTPSKWTPSKRTALKPISSMATSLLTVLILVEATRRGQLPDIAAYTAGASIGAIVAAIAGSGTSLAYVTGDSFAQSGVRRVRHLLVAPAMFVSVLGASFLYETSTELDLIPILIGGLSVVLNNLSELDAASLERRLETPKLLLSSVVSRTIGLLSLIAGAEFSVAMLTSSLAAFFILRIFARAYTVTTERVPGLFESVKQAYAPSLMGLSVLGIVVNRAALVVAPFVMSAGHAGALSALISGQQSMTAVLISGLYTVMAARSEVGAIQGWMRKVASRTLFVAGASAILAAASAPLVVIILHLEGIPGASAWWIFLGLAIFPYVYNRKIEYAFLGDGKRWRALQLLSMNSGFALIACGIAAVLRSPTVLAAVSLISETLTVFGLVVIRHVLLRRPGSRASR